MTDADVILELPEAWFANPVDGERHRQFYVSIWLALADLGVTVRPIVVRFGADEAPRLSQHGQLVLSFHSRGEADRNILRLKESYLPPYYTIDRMGYSGFSELAQFPERFEADIQAVPTRDALAFVEALKAEVVGTNLSKYHQPQVASGERLPEHFVFQPLQTIDDPVAALTHLDQLDVLEATAVACEALGWSVVFKRHPWCRAERVSARLAQLMATYPNLRQSQASIHPLISAAQAVIGANSGVLFEALLHGAHVIRFAQTDFAIATTAITSLQDIAGALLGRGRVARPLQVQFLMWYLQTYCVRGDDVAGIRSKMAAALAALDRRPGSWHQEQLDLFDLYAGQEAARRAAVLSGVSFSSEV